MAKLTCSKSSVLFSCEHMPITLSSREYAHPMFSVSKKKLLGLSGKWAANQLSPTESYLLYLSLLDSTDLIIWRVPAIYTNQTAQIVSNNMEQLIRIIGKIDVISHPAFVLPKFAISPDTCDLTNSVHWIQAWHTNYVDWYDGLAESAAAEKLKSTLSTREESLHRLIKSPTSKANESQLAPILAGWAEVAGGFPSFKTLHPVTKTYLPVSEYWKQIIRACANEDSIWKFPLSDITELIEHCEDNVIHGSIYAHALMKLLRSGAKKHTDYLGFGDVDLSGRSATVFSLLDATSSAGDANKLAAIQSAPDHEPRPQSYPNRFAYLKAKLSWDMAQRYKANGDKL
jgi:hypothetical protein